MSDQDIDEIARRSAELAAEKVMQKLSGTRFIAPEEHWEDHQWVRASMSRQEANAGRRQQFIDKVVGSVAIVAILGFIAWLGHAVLTTLSEMLGRGGPP
jgi:hypothetical protein